MSMNTINDPIRRFDPLDWDMIPDIGLYMDQVITLITRMYEPLFGAKAAEYISSSMINNYVKSKLIPRPIGKKYSRTQIALLIMIVYLKQVSTMEDIRKMMPQTDEEQIAPLYEQFCDRLRQILNLLVDTYETTQSPLDFAILSAGYRTACEAILKDSDSK